MGVFRFDTVPTALCIALAFAAMPATAGDAAAWNWRLAGVIVGPGVARALFARDGETQSVRIGGQIDGRTLASIRPDGVTLTGADGERVVHPEAAATDNAVRPPVLAVPTVAEAARAQQQDQATGEKALATATRQMIQAGSARPAR